MACAHEAPPSDGLNEWLNLPDSNTDRLFKFLDPKKFVASFWDASVRPDGRTMARARPASAVTSSLKHSAGSALVKMGDTKVLAATTARIGQPAPDRPDRGDAFVTVETGDDRNYEDGLQARLQRILDELLPPRLNLFTGKACIRLVVTVMVLQDAGNILDASVLACMSAWKDTKLPQIDDMQLVDGRYFWKDKPTSSLSEVKSTPPHESREYRICLSMGVIKQGEETVLLVDPTKEEEAHLEGLLSIIVDISTRNLQFDYSGPTPLSAVDLALAAKMANGRAEELSKLLL